jgi:AcrR family transcriptional regulator
VSRGWVLSVLRAWPAATTRLACVSMTPLGRPVVPLETLLELWLQYVPLILPVARALEAAVITGDEGEAAWRDRMDDIHETFRLAVERIEGEGRLAEGWTVDTAADWVYAHSHVATWQHLVVDRGWPAQRYVERTIAAIMTEVVAPADDE